MQKSEEAEPSGNLNMEEGADFLGFPENDAVRSTIQDKLARLKRIRIEDPSSHLQQPASPAAQQRRPMNRFLKRNDSLSSSPGKSSSPIPRAEKSTLEPKPLASPSSSVKSLQQNLSPVKDSLPAIASTSSSSVAVPKSIAISKDEKTITATPPPSKEANTATAVSNNATTSTTRVVPERFLRKAPVKKQAKESETNHQERSAPSRKVVESIMGKVASSTITAAKVPTQIKEDAKPAPTLVASNNVNSKEEPNKKNAAVASEEAHTPSADCNLDKSKAVGKPGKSVRDPEMPSLVSNNSSKDSSKSEKVAPTKPPSPAKRTTTSLSSDLSFLPGQSSRSKRTIVPNKRFISCDSPPPTLSKQLDSTSSNGTTTTQQQQQNNPPKVAPKKTVHATGNTKAPPPVSSSNKKRSISGDSSGVKTAVNRKRKLSAENPLSPPIVANGSPSNTLTSQVGSTHSSSAIMDSNMARPRRTIIPNRKFMDEEEPAVVKEPVVKKAPPAEVVEHNKRKRRKSEKAIVVENTIVKLPSNKNDGLPPPPPVHISNNNTPAVQVNGTSASSSAKEAFGASAIAQIISTVHQPVAPILNGSSVPPPPAGKPDVKIKVEVKLPPPEPVEVKVDVKVPIPTAEFKVDDELPISESEESSYGTKPVFLGTCILKSSEQQSKDQENGQPSSGLICCGICSRVKKYRTLTDKRKRGSFLCIDCGGIVNKIFQIAMKARPFSCILGPPVCEGSCPLIFSPPDQFCQACFAKTCLKNLPMKDDIYFKIWRSIPPMSRGCVPTAPMTNTASPNVGKLAFVDDSGEIISTTGSLKVFGGKKNAAGVEAISEDSNSSNDVLLNGDGDLNSARLTTFAHRTGGVSNNRENAVPLKNAMGESQSSSSSTSTSAAADHFKETIKSNGVMKEEIVLDRQIGQERVAAALVDPILKPDLEHIEIFGFPLIVSGPCYPRKPLCFLCGSAGIEQLIYCSCCCEPYHPYCAGDDLLLDTYIARCSDKENGSDGSEVVDPSRLALKWTCRRCLSCKSCGLCIGRKELIRCTRCQNPYHLDSCIDKQILSKVKDRSKLKKVWTCDTCMECKSCGKRIESNRRLRTIQEVAAAAKDSDSEEDEESDKDGESCEDASAAPPANQVNCLMLCLDCFKQRKKGSYCPLCEACYDDNDWDSKMIECCKCNRWIHATCENLSDEQYTILGTLPDYIEYNCRLCHDSPSTPLWYDAIQTQLLKSFNSAIRLFEHKSLDPLRRKRSSTTDATKPSFVCNLFGASSGEENQNLEAFNKSEVTLKLVKDDEVDNLQLEEEKRLLRRDMTRSVTYKELMGCKLVLRDFVKFPATLQENWYALKSMKVEILLDYDPNYMKQVEPRVPRTPIHTTPKKMFTPTKHITGISNAVKNMVGSITSLRVFQKLLISTIGKTCESEVEKDTLVGNLMSAIEETFPWFVQNASVEEKEESQEIMLDTSTIIPEGDKGECAANQFVLTTDPFKETYWDPCDFFDDRVCSLCGEVGDFPPELCGRLLWCGVNEWIHCNCAIWSSEVFEKENGALQQVGAALNRGKTFRCGVCQQRGATVNCCKSNCKRSYHFKCAMEAECFLLKDKTMFCSHHKLTPVQLDDIQEDMKLGRKVFVDLDWIQKRGMKAYSNDTKLFIGSLKINDLGALVPISVVTKEYSDSLGTTLLISENFQSQRIFWSVDNPWIKECYTFQAGVSSNGFQHSSVQDVGVNLVVNHTKKEETVQRGMASVQKFHQWIQKAPRYIDKNLVDWFPPCSEEFYVSVTDDEEDESGIDAFDSMSNRGAAMGRSSPSSVSSFGSFAPVSLRSRKRSIPYSLRGISNRRDMCGTNESVYNEGYASSVESSAETPRSRRAKRRRSSCKSPKSQSKRIKLSESMNKYESPRRRSMRNLHLKESASNTNDNDGCTAWKRKSGRLSKEYVDSSDNDSGVTEGTSTSGICEESRPVRRVNLLSQFNASFEEEQHRNAPISHDDKEEIVQDVVESEPFPMESISLLSSSLEDPGINSQMEETVFSQFCDEPDGKVYTASIRFDVKTRNTTIFHSCDAIQAGKFLFEEVCKTRGAHGLETLAHPSLNFDKLPGDDMEGANSFRMLGVSHRNVQYLLEQLPGNLCVVDQHKFVYSHKPYVDPNNENAVVRQNSTGSARSEGFQGRKPFDMFGWLASRHRKVTSTCDTSLEESSRTKGLPSAMQFRDLKEKARKRFVVRRSEIHGRGLFAQCDMEQGEMLIEYAGEVIRPSLSDPRERYYESRGIGCYMFRIKTQVIDATLKGNAARFINHSCEPNCEAKTIRILGNDHIIIFSLRKIFKDEELTYDYKFAREENKIPCYCGAPRCRKYMN